MGQILRNWRVVSSLIFSIVLITGAYLLAKGVESPPYAQASMESELLEAIATKDTDGDGLTDWEEALYGTDPKLTDTRSLGMTDGEAVQKGLVVPKAVADLPAPVISSIQYDEHGLPPPPAEGTLTDAFTKLFLSSYLSAREAHGEQLSEEQMQQIANESIAALSSIVVLAPDYKTAKDISVQGSGKDAFVQYLADVEAIFKKNTANVSKSQIVYLKDAVEKSDTEALKHIAEIAEAFRNGAVGLTALSVPQEVAQAHLALVNSMMRLSEITFDFARLQEDPLATIIALEQYQPTAESFAGSFKAVGLVSEAMEIRIPENAPGAAFLAVVQGAVSIPVPE